MGAFLVEQKFFRKVNMIFLIKGHTKNMCDRMFNQMKRNYRKRNVYTLEDTYKILDLQDNVIVVPVKGEELFRDWDEIFDEIYKRPKAGTIKKNHIFSYSDDTIDTVIITTKTSDHSSSMQTQQFIKLKKKWTPEERLDKMSDIDPLSLTRDRKSTRLNSSHP